MSQQSLLPEDSQLDGSRTSGAVSSYAVGYGKPPTHTRFKPGQSGNPKGKRKGRRNVRTVVEETLNQRITIREGERTRSLTKLDAVILTMINAALKNDPKSQASLIALVRSVGITDDAPEPASQKPFTANDTGLLADFLRRHASEVQQIDKPEDNETPKPIGTSHSDTRTTS